MWWEIHLFLLGNLESPLEWFKRKQRDFPGSPVGNKTPCFHCRRHGFHPWSGNKDPTCHMAKKEREKEKSRNPASKEVERGILGGGNRLFKGPEVGEDQP